MAVVVARQRVCAGATRVGEALRRKHAWPRAAGLTAHQTLVAAQRALTITHIRRGPRQRQARRRCPGHWGRNARRRGFSLRKVPQIPKNFQRPGALPPDPRQHTVQLLCCAALARAKKNRTPSGDGMESACHVWVFRAKREKFFEALFGVTLHHLNLDPASSPEALMPARKPSCGSTSDFG